jgi:hypothetical protein
MQFSLQGCDAFTVTPIFVPQHHFDRSKEPAGHFLCGNTLKYRVLLSALEKHPGETVLFTDADLIILDLESFIPYVNSYAEKYDMVFMKEGQHISSYNIGMMLIRSTPDTIAYFKMIIERVETHGTLDQVELTAQIHQFPGSHTSFSYPEIIQSNEYSDDINPYIIQCLSSLPGYTLSFAEKLASVVCFFDITPFRQFISNDVEETLKKIVLESTPDHYLKGWD